MDAHDAIKRRSGLLLEALREGYTDEEGETTGLIISYLTIVEVVSSSTGDSLVHLYTNDNRTSISLGLINHARIQLEATLQAQIARLMFGLEE